MVTLRHRLIAATFAVLAAIVALGAWWVEHTVNGLSFTFVAIAAWPLGMAVALGTHVLVRGNTKPRLGRLLTMAGGSAVLSLVVFFGLWNRFTYARYVRGELRRYLVAYNYGNDADKLVGEAAQKGVTFDYGKLLDEFEENPELIFDSSSLAIVQTAFAASWLLLAASSMAVAALLALLIQQEHIDPLVARARHSIEGWPRVMPADLKAKMQAALETLTLPTEPEPGNCVRTLYKLFAERTGLLHQIANAHPQGPRTEKFWDEPFEKQIDGISKLGILRYDVSSDLHDIRVAENSCKHRGLDSLELAALTLVHAVRVIEWYAFEYEFGPHVPKRPARS